MYHFYSQVDDQSETCFNVQTSRPLNVNELKKLRGILTDGFSPESISSKSALRDNKENIIEIGPRLSFATAFSTNAVAICHSCGLKKVERIERSRIFYVLDNKKEFVEKNHDRMTECVYQKPLASFQSKMKPNSFSIVPIIEKGIDALKKINKEMGLGMDDWDEKFYYNLFVKDIKRNPTNVECFQLGQANSEHSRHWFFKGKMFIDGEEMPETLIQIIASTLKANRGNSIIAFKDNSSAINGFNIKTLVPEKPGQVTLFKKENLKYHIIFTAETHNFPSGIAPFPGAETGGGGRIRDVQATGRGALVVAGTAGYCVGNLNIPKYNLPWENKEFSYPSNLASPLKIAIDASNGASDYGNKFGEPLIQGFTRSFGMELPSGERQEWLKPIMFSGGVGQIDDRHTEKKKPQEGMLIVQIGGPAYRIGMGGGSASSMIQGENAAELDFNAVQRGDAEMEQKMNRVIRACVEMGNKNPILSIHDQGAGGPCNVITELVEPAGGKVEIRNIILGDKTLSILEIWGAEYQERNALLIDPRRIEELSEICARERSSYEILGAITGDGKIVVEDKKYRSKVVDLELKKILGKMPQKTFKDIRLKTEFKPIVFPRNMTLKKALSDVLRLPSVGSKRFLTSKVDRSVTGLIARQQCCGPLQLTVSDVSVIAQSHFGKTGSAISIGEQPIKMIINPQAGARMSVAEALTNIVWAKISKLQDIKCSGNWMWAAKLPGEMSRIYDAAVAARDLMVKLGIAVDGGKDSLSMAAKVGNDIVKSPGELTISAYAPVFNIENVITPDIKKPGKSELWLLDLGSGKYRLGGTAFGQTLNQLGNESPDVDDATVLEKIFNAVQEMVEKKVILSGHDRSDGGLIVTLLEMAFAGNCGIKANINNAKTSPLEYFFNEEVGVLVEVEFGLVEKFRNILKKYKIENLATKIGNTAKSQNIKIKFKEKVELDGDMRKLRRIWEETSFQLEKIQTNEKQAKEEKKNIFDRKNPINKLTFSPEETLSIVIHKKNRPRVAIIREEGSNGDREMTSAFYLAGFEPWDVTMSDLIEKRISLGRFRGVAFVGGFSYADVFNSAKGWASTIRFNEVLRKEFDDFYHRKDTFSLGVCNGCQLMGLLGWVPWRGISDERQPRFIRNFSQRFESRWVNVKILTSPSIMLRGMEGSILGTWVAHGEGRLNFPDKKIMREVKNKMLASVAFVDDSGKQTERYPFNPNGSPEGITGLCSPDGRHLALMPHPERAFLKWQWSWMPDDIQKQCSASPWLKMFQNAREWCELNK